jgi:hypothetical protein
LTHLNILGTDSVGASIILSAPVAKLKILMEGQCRLLSSDEDNYVLKPASPHGAQPDSKHLHLHIGGDDDYDAIYMSESVTIGLRRVQTFLKEDPITGGRNLPTQETSDLWHILRWILVQHILNFTIHCNPSISDNMIKEKTSFNKKSHLLNLAYN